MRWWSSKSNGPGSGLTAPLQRCARSSCVVALGLALTACGKTTDDGVFAIHDAHLDWSSQPARLMVKLQAQLGQAPMEALRHGIVVPLQWAFESRRSGQGAGATWRLNGTRYLSYRPLTRHFAVDDQPGDQSSYPDAVEMARALARFSIALPDLPASLDRGEYQLRFRIRLDVSELPPSLRLPGYLSSAWRLDSGWYEWPLRRAAIAASD